MVFVYLFISAVIVLIDQIVKTWVVNNIEHHSSIDFIKFGSKKIVDLTYHKNTGAAFSIFSDHTLVLALITSAFCLIGVIYLFKTKNRHVLNLLSISLIIGGGVGNVIDRFDKKFVVDYIELKIFNFAIFNIADICVVAGAILLAIFVIFIDESNEKPSVTKDD